ncbi:von Willebrand factor type A domain-containing protein [Sphingobacterium paramultivorum]|uniref:von Willebrand factor type A domain-containing protein n=1 Tax=Sphingobacterium paramultivorum TaxID=2886510 RepID=A0A7G5E9K8_9SPHI|nr:VWA domain-containing protein [Sphingobacterium paramultivorum]QMV70683.1 von Willebrand factor type A domain-containing protein [Sphingobacterium paramultivorum]WSO14555.1 von Willebrand factor type A domain-containing protein [Sphingobacterium paramultivorum]
MRAILFVIGLLLSLGGYAKQGYEVRGKVVDANTGTALVGVQVSNVATKSLVQTDDKGNYRIQVLDGKNMLIFSYIGYLEQRIAVNHRSKVDVALAQQNNALDEVVVTGYEHKAKRQTASVMNVNAAMYGQVSGLYIRGTAYVPNQNQESYQKLKENSFINPLKEPLSTFAADVDAASYSNVRRFINSGTLPEKDAVRVEEMINYFQYQVAGPKNGEPVNIVTELTKAPWNTTHQLMRVTLKAKDIPTANLTASNLVFLIDVSGSMMGPGRLPLVKASLKMLVDQLRAVDHVAIVTYAGSAGVKLESTPGDEKMKIKSAIEELEAGGSTAGAAGIKKAYEIAKQQFIKGGNNRIILASDGDFNVGESSDESMEELISKESKSGVFLTVLGYGMGNLKDSKMEILADKGHGNYAYIDNISEARKAMVTEFGGTLFTVAKDVKIQVEFNPSYVQAYRLVGYENRLLEAEDFNNDQKIGGDMGVGHVVTALYEIVPVGVESGLIGTVDPLKYQQQADQAAGRRNAELATVKFRYKEPEGEKSKLQQKVVGTSVTELNSVSEDLRFVTAVAELGLLLRDSDFKQKANFDQLIARAKASKGKDEEGYRAEFIRIAENARDLSRLKE